MLKLRTIVQRLYSLIPQNTSERELDEELRFHLDMRTADNLASGMTSREATMDARRRFGDVDQIKRLCRTIDEDTVWRKRLFVLLWLVAISGVLLWAKIGVAQVNVLGEMLVLTALMCRLLLTAPRVSRPSPLNSDFNESSLVLTIEPLKQEVRDDPQTLLLSQRHEHEYNHEAPRRKFIPLFAAATTLCAIFLCIIVFTFSARAFTFYLKQSQSKADSAIQPTVEKFVGKWTATIADMLGGKDSPVPPPFRDLPTNLTVAEVTLKLEDGKLSGTRVIYSYTKGADGSPTVSEKGELELSEIRFDGHVLSGGVTTSEGQKLPGGWEMKLTGENEAEVRLTGEEGGQQKQPPVKLHRTQR